MMYCTLLVKKIYLVIFKIFLMLTEAAFIHKVTYCNIIKI